MKYAIGAMLAALALASCSFNENKNVYLSITGAYSVGSYIYPVYSLYDSSQGGTTDDLDNYPDNLYQAIHIDGKMLGSGLYVTPVFTASDAQWTTATIDPTVHLSDMIVNGPGAYMGTTTYKFHFVTNQITTISIPNAIFYKLSANLDVNRSTISLVDINGKGGYFLIYASKTSVSYASFSSLTGEDIYVAVSLWKSTGPTTGYDVYGYLTQDGTVHTDKTPFGAGWKFAPGLFFDLSNITY